jgi:hypothetical protein
VVSFDAGAEEGHGSWLDALPIKDSKKEQLATVAGVLESGIEQAHSLKETIKTNKVKVKIQSKQLLILF